MELRFVVKNLQGLDGLDIEVLACTTFSDVRPAHGVAGLCDFRLGGRISTLMRRGLVTGDKGESIMLPGKPKLTFDKLLLFGLGPRATFQEEVFRDVVTRMLTTMTGLCTRVAVVELPGRHDGLIAADRAADVLLECAGRGREDDVWTLVENSEGQKQITQHLIEQKRRIRRVL